MAANSVSGLCEAFVTVRQTNEAHVSALEELERDTAETKRPHAFAKTGQTNTAHVSALDALERAFTAETVLLAASLDSTAQTIS